MENLNKTEHISTRFDNKHLFDFQPYDRSLNYTAVTKITATLSADSIAKWIERIGIEQAEKIKRYSAARGKSVHTLVEQYLTNQQVQSSDHTFHVQNIYQQVITALTSGNPCIHAVEFPLFSHKLKIQGRGDILATFNNELSIIDVKTSDKYKKAQYLQDYIVQITMYALMLYERTNVCPTKGVIIIGVQNELQPQVHIFNIKDHITSTLNIIKQYNDSKIID